ncbi:carbohydrate sulfotransferase 3-like [Saccoglossus kowalevskii]|uniref:Carbohydrate sulfotransferase 3-like n=1 Tax=Saccoglossus kowalevskii TaxID=10224 RepID=A0ABM0H1W7_SACKO|nr:PREDICTED: carbohydrate sulfotransferase 3-like [Saccoglossus kowalevskii]
MTDYTARSAKRQSRIMNRMAALSVLGVCSVGLLMYTWLFLGEQHEYMYLEDAHYQGNDFNEEMDEREGMTSFTMDNIDRNPAIPKVDKQMSSKAVLLFATKRSGSSFVGELLNQNPETMYLFEPLRSLSFDVLGGDSANDLFESWAIEVVGNLFKCELSDQIMAPTLRDDRMCRSLALRSTCRLHHRFPFNEKNVQPNQNNDDLFVVSVAKQCKKHKYRAIKTIRLYDLKELEVLVTESNIDLKIIILVRDPRGVMHSRWKLHGKNLDYMRKNASWDETEDLCRTYASNVRYAQTCPEWLKNRYLLIRYEDVAHQPLARAREIYNFLDMSMPQNIEAWIQQNTQSTGNYPNGVTRVSSLVATKWREELPFEQILKIQEKCQASMNFLGYKMVTNMAALRNESSVLGPPVNPFTECAN